MNLSRTATLDIAYQYKTDRLSHYQLFFSRSEGGDFKTYSGRYDTHLTHHFVTMTLAFRF